MNRPLSASSRSAVIKDLESATFDLLIIGGGITGAGIAWDAAKRGMKTVLIEQNDFAFGTSSRSTKLIHGGLRYLKKGEIKLVREVGREREWLYRHAPHMVTPMPMLLPIYKGGTFGYFTSSIGLFLYDFLAGVRKTERRIMHRADEAIRLEPLLKREGLKGAGSYYEYRSDDARLTVEVLKTAAQHGAWAVNYVEATDFLYYRSKAAGVRAVDRITGAELEIRAKCIVNAAGPWVDAVRSKDHAVKDKHLLLTKGVHLVVDHSKVPVRQAAYFDVPDGRMIFVIPRDGKTYIGTTDTVYSGNPVGPRTTEADRDYLLKAVKLAFPHVKVGPDDVEAMWAGLRPLIQEGEKKPSDISRRDEIWVSSSGLISIAGGKLTGFRKMAEKTVDQVVESLSQEVRQTYGPCTTAKEVLSGGDSGRCETYEELKDQLIRLGVKKGLTIKMAAYLVKLYGSNSADIYMRLEGLEHRFEELAEKRRQHEAEEQIEPAVEAESNVSSDDSSVVDAVGLQGLEQEDGEGQLTGAAENISQSDRSPAVQPEGRGYAVPESAANSSLPSGQEEPRPYNSSRNKAMAGAHGERSKMRPSDVTNPESDWRALVAEVHYCIDCEMVLNADDFLVRRTGLLYFDRDRAESIALDVIDIMADKLNWDDEEIMAQKLRLSREWEAATVAPGKE